VDEEAFVGLMMRRRKRSLSAEAEATTDESPLSLTTMTVDTLVQAIADTESTMRALFVSTTAYDAFMEGFALPYHEYLRKIEEQARELEGLEKRRMNLRRARMAFAIGMEHHPQLEQRVRMAASVDWMDGELRLITDLLVTRQRAYVRWLSTTTPIDTSAFREQLADLLGRRAQLLSRFRKAQVQACGGN
jgi:hypothetical protein